MAEKLIGIVGGVGSYAGLSLIKNIYDLSEATCDQEHLPVAMLALPAQTPDRTQYLLGEIDTNPGIIIAEIITTLVGAGAEIIGIPCNTAHAKPIYNHILTHIPSSVKMIHLIEEVGIHLQKYHPEMRKVGLLATNGTLASNIYRDTLEKYNLEVIYPNDNIQENLVQAAIYDKDYGIKAFASPLKTRAINDLMKAGSALCEEGAETVILGCTEIALALSGVLIEKRITIDSVAVLATALIRESRGK